MVIKKFAFIILLIIPFQILLSQSLDQDYYTSIIATSNFENNATDNDDGQSFTSGLTGDLTSIRVVLFAEDVFNSCSPGDETVLNMELHAGDGFGGSVLGTSDSVTVVDGYNVLTEFVFSTPIAITSGSMYTFEVNIVSEDCSNLFTNLEAVSVGTYLNGTAYDAGVVHPADILFQTYVNNPLNTEENKFDRTIRVYPNPVQDLLYIVNAEDLKSTKIYNTLGQLIIETKEKKIDFKNLNRGVYFLRINTHKGLISKKIIKQ